MIIYSNSIKNFCNEVTNISSILTNKFKDVFHKFSNKSEIQSWNKSLKYFSDILSETNLDNTVTITLEYNLPLTSNRIDLILTGYNNSKNPIVLVFELKQWENVNNIVDSNYLVQTFLNGCLRNVVHPGYQVWSYSEILKNYNEYIQENNVEIRSCLLMHNYKFKNNDILLQEKYNEFMNDVFYFGVDDKKN